MKKIIFLLLLSFSAFSQNDTIFVELQNGARLYSKPDINSSKIDLSKSGKYLFVGIIGDYYIIKSNNTDCFVKKYWINPNEKVKNYEEKQLFEQSEKIRIIKQNIADDKIKDSIAIDKILRKDEIFKNNKSASILKKYGPLIHKKLKSGKIWIGINKEMALFALGEPSDINRTVTKYKVSEQWVYNGLYVYFENDKIISFQD